MTRFISAAVLAALLSAGPCLAQDVSAKAVEARYSKAFKVCMDAPSASSTLGMLNCDAEETKRQDKRLNDVYQRVVKKFAPERQKRLQSAQRAWIAFRDAECLIWQTSDDGTAGSLNGAGCYLDRTISRTIELEYLDTTEALENPNR